MSSRIACAQSRLKAPRSAVMPSPYSAPMIVATSYAGATAVLRSSSVVVIVMLQRSSRVSNHIRRPDAASQANSRLPALTSRQRDPRARIHRFAEARLARCRPRERLHPHAAPPARSGRVLRVIHDPVLGGVGRGDEARVPDTEHPRVPGEHRAALHPVLGLQRIGGGVAEAELPERVVLQPRIARGVEHEDVAVVPEKLWPL